MLELNKIYCGDCLEVMKDIPDGSIDAVICDPPYGTTACKWDTCIPFELMWEQLKRVTKKNGAIVLFGSQPFTSALVMSNPKMFKYEWVWEKSKATGFFDAKKRPLNNYEDICVFYEKQPTYNPQMTKAERIYKRGFVKRKKSDCYGDEKDFEQKETGERHPKRIVKMGNADTSGICHPTQKPVALMEYLIKTYTNEGEIVLDFTCGSGTTLVAARNLNRRFIGIEKDEKYCQIAEARIRAINCQLFVNR